MKNINEILEDLKNRNGLNNNVIEILQDEDFEEIEELENYLNDITKYGCQAGTCNSMIYYEDTIKFYNDNKEDINDLINLYGLKLEDLNGFDESDPLCLEEVNQNLLAWFGFEETSRDLLEKLKREVY